MALNQLGEKAKETLEKLVKLIDKRLEKSWENELTEGFGFNETQKKLTREILNHAKEHNLRPAKRIRAAFVYFGYKLGKKIGNENKIWEAMEAIELVHTALLMHDDFMDKDKVRRGLPTTQEFFGKEDIHYGEAMAVNVGDAVLCLGFEKLLSCGLETKKVQRAMNQLLRGIANTAYGQAYDVSLPKLGDLTEEKVLNLHKAKTAIYTYENPLFIGAILAGLSSEVLEILHNYAIWGGVAFQLQDDVLGVFGNQEKTGKSVDSDLLQGKVTLLVVKTLEMGNQKQKEALLKVWGKPSVKKEEIFLAKEAICECGAYEYSLKVARDLATKAAEETSKLRKLKMDNEAVDFLEGIARYMVEREI